MSCLPSKKASFAVAGKPGFSKASEPNTNLPRLSGSVANSKHDAFTYFDASKLEACAKQALESQSLAYWFFETIINWMKRENFAPSEPDMFEEVIGAFSYAMVNSTIVIYYSTVVYLYYINLVLYIFYIT